MTEKMTTGEALAELRAVGYDAREWTGGGLTTIYLNDRGDGRILAGRWDLKINADAVWLAVHRAIAGLRCEDCGRPANDELCAFCDHRDRTENLELAWADVAAGVF